MQKKKVLDEKTITEDDIAGNDGADKLADEGVKMHASNAYMAKRAEHRKELTIMVQKMYLEIWALYTQDADTVVSQLRNPTCKNWKTSFSN